MFGLVFLLFSSIVTLKLLELVTHIPSVTSEVLQHLVLTNFSNQVNTTSDVQKLQRRYLFNKNSAEADPAV